MATRTVYVEPGDTIEVRVCDTAFVMGANIQAWKQSARPPRFLIAVDGVDEITVPPMFNVFAWGGPGRRRQMLMAPEPSAKAEAPPTQREAQMDDVQECRRCDGSGEIAISATTCRFVAPWPVPDDAKGVAVATCDQCAGFGYVEVREQSHDR